MRRLSLLFRINILYVARLLILLFFIELRNDESLTLSMAFIHILLILFFFLESKGYGFHPITLIP
jgi:hypothetical protein